MERGGGRGTVGKKRTGASHPWPQPRRGSPHPATRDPFDRRRNAPPPGVPKPPRNSRRGPLPEIGGELWGGARILFPPGGNFPPLTTLPREKGQPGAKTPFYGTGETNEIPPRGGKNWA